MISAAKFPPVSSQRRSVPIRPLEGVKVVVVEDDQDSRELLAELLAEAGAQVQAAESAASGFAAFNAFRPDLLISDIGMPDEDGHSLARRIRASEAPDDGRTPLIALTAFTRAQDRERTKESGFDLHLPKPVEIDTLLDSVRALAPKSIK